MDNKKEQFIGIANEVQNAINDCFQFAGKNNPNAFILFLAKARWYGDPINNYLLDYMGDDYKDETRNSFYAHYMKEFYPTRLYDYKEDTSNCAYNLQIEMLIYAQLWESHPLLYRLASLAQTCTDEFYDWKLTIPDSRLHEFITEKIITPLKDKRLKLGDIIESCYNSNFRNALAHGLYSIDVENGTIQLSNRDAVKNGNTHYAFAAFQNMFVHAVLLDNILQNLLHEYRSNAADIALSLPSFQISREDSRLIAISASRNNETGRIKFNGIISNRKRLKSNTINQ